MVRQLRDTLLRRPDEVVEAINARMAALAADERFEEAGVHRDRLAAFVRAAARTQRLSRPDPAAPRWWPRAARTTAAGRCTSSATAGWPRPG